MKFLFVALALLAFLATPAVDVPAAKPASRPGWEAVQSDIPVAKAVRIEVRLIGADGAPVTAPVTLASTRLDMAPDGMAEMTAPLRALPSPRPGILAFETEIVMAGQWQLSLSGTPAGQTAPVSGAVILSATAKQASPSVPQGDRKPRYYRNPMGLPDVSPVPKKDSMGMDYIPVYEDEVSGPPGTVRVSPEKVQRAGVRVAPVARQMITRTVRGVGTVTPHEARLAVVTARFGGFVEELLVPLTGTEVRQGTPLMRVWIESPEILRKQADFLTALRGTSGRPADVEAAAHNLRLFGIPDQAIEQLRRTGEPVRSLVLTATARGTVLEKPAMVGMRFEPGATLFRTADLSVVWIIAQVAERDIAALRIGQTARVSLSAFPGTVLEGRLAFVYPELDTVTRTARLRIELANPDGRLKAGLYGDVEIEAPATSRPVLAIPASAVIDSGRRRVAFVAGEDGRFEPRDLVLGARGNGLVEVREGLAEGERIVVTGNFLIDAESNLKAALSAFTAPEGGK